MLVNDRSIRRHVELTYALYTCEGSDDRACALINGVYDVERAQKKLRRHFKDPSIVVSRVEHRETDFVMTLEKFMMNATEERN